MTSSVDLLVLETYWCGSRVAGMFFFLMFSATQVGVASGFVDFKQYVVLSAPLGEIVDI